MPKRVPTQTIVLFRDGKQVVPEIGKPFDFTNDEYKEITAMNKDALSKIAERDLSEEDAADALKAKEKLEQELAANSSKKTKGDKSEDGL